MTRVLVAGVGNLFFGDDGFGCEVARRLSRTQPPSPEGGATFADFGVRGVHLAYELSSGYHAAVLIDAVRRGGRPGTLYVIDPDLDEKQGARPDPHGIDLAAVLALARALGPLPARIVVVGCEADDLDERIGLSEPVARAVEPAMALVQSLLREAEGARP